MIYSLCAVVGACSGGDTAPAPVEAAGATGADAAWVSKSGSGIAVRLEPQTPVVQAGLAIFRITTPADGPHRTVKSVDLVSPAMPLHGVVRFPVEEAGPYSYLAGVHIPMDGRWALYVNFDDGSDAAEFLFDVAPSPAGAHPQRRMAADSEPAPAEHDASHHHEISDTRTGLDEHSHLHPHAH
jgi:hypothetical protein